MRLPALALSLALALPAQAYDWVEGSIIGVPAAGPSSHMMSAVFISSGVAGQESGPAQNTWATLDLSALLPVGTKAVHLSGILVITHGTAPETCDLTVAFRTPGQTTDYAYVMQAVEAHTGGGQRSTAATWVAVDANRHIQIKWNRSTSGYWPQNCSYVINLRATGYMR